MTLAEQLIQEGAEKGRVEGRLEGRRTTLRCQLEAKFGQVPSSALERIETANEPDLTGWTRRILSADSVEAVFGD